MFDKQIEELVTQISQYLSENDCNNKAFEFIQDINDPGAVEKTFGEDNVWVFVPIIQIVDLTNSTDPNQMSSDKCTSFRNILEKSSPEIKGKKRFEGLKALWNQLIQFKEVEMKTNNAITNNDPNNGLQAMNAHGDDRNLAIHGADKRYWYSIRDGMALLVVIRKAKFHYDQGIYTEYGENEEGVFLANPYHKLNFEESLKGDIERIMGKYGVIAWAQKPKVMIIPVLSGLHWRCIRIEIDATKKTVCVLFDDPYGEGRFDPRLKDTILGSIKKHVAKLFVVGIHEIVYSELEKAVNQQGNNRYNCGPIVFGNIEDYSNPNKTNASFITKEGFNIVSEAVDENHEKSIGELRERHIKEFQAVDGTAINLNYLQSIRQFIKANNDRKRESLSAVDTDADILQAIQELPEEYQEWIFNGAENGAITLSQAYESLMAEEQFYGKQRADGIGSGAQIAPLSAEITTQQPSKDPGGSNHGATINEDNKQRDLASLLNMYETIVKLEKNQITLIKAISCISKKAGGLGGLSFNDRSGKTIRNKYGYRQRHEGNTINTSGPGIIYFEYLYRVHIILKNLNFKDIPAKFELGFRKDLTILQKKILYILGKEEPNQLKEKIEGVIGLADDDANNLEAINKFVDANYKKVAAKMVVDAAGCLKTVDLKNHNHKYYAARKLVIIGELLHELETDCGINLQQTRIDNSKSKKTSAMQKVGSGMKQSLALHVHTNSIRNNLVHWHTRFLRVLENPKVLEEVQKGIPALAKISVENILDPTQQGGAEVVAGALQLKKALENPLKEEVESEIFHILDTANKIRGIFASQEYKEVKEFYDLNLSELKDAGKLFKEEYGNKDIKELIKDLEGLKKNNNATQYLKRLVQNLKKFVRQQGLALIEERYNNLMMHEEYAVLLDLAKGEIEDFDIKDLDQVPKICKNLTKIIEEERFVEQSKKLKSCLTDLMKARKEEVRIKECRQAAPDKDFTEIDFHDAEQIKRIQTQTNDKQLKRVLTEFMKIQSEPVNIKSLEELSKEYSREVEKIKKLPSQDQETLKSYTEISLTLENLEKLKQVRQHVANKLKPNRLTTLIGLINLEMEYLRKVGLDSTVSSEHKQGVIEHIITIIGQYLRDIESSDKGRELKGLATKTFDIASYSSKLARSNGLAHDIFSLNENLLSDRVRYDILPARRDHEAIFTIRKSGPVTVNMTAMVLHSLGNAFYRLGFYKEAIDCLKKALLDIRDNNEIKGTPNFRTKLDQYKLDAIGITQPTAICIDMTYNLFGIDSYELDILSDLSTIASDSNDNDVMTDIIKFIKKTIDTDRVKKYKGALTKIGDSGDDVLLQLLAELDPETFKVYSSIIETITTVAAPFVLYYPKDNQTLDKISLIFSGMGRTMLRRGSLDVAGSLFETSIELSGSKHCHENADLDSAECARRAGNVDKARELYNQTWEDPVNGFVAKLKLAEISQDERRDIKSELTELDSIFKKHKNIFDDSYGDRTLDYQLHLYGLKLKNYAKPLRPDPESLESQFQEAEALINSNKLRFQNLDSVRNFYLVASMAFAILASGKMQLEKVRYMLSKSEYCYNKGCTSTSLSYQAAEMLANGYNYCAKDFPLEPAEKAECLEKFNYYSLQVQPSCTSPSHNTMGLRDIPRHSSTSLSNSTNLTTATDPSIITSNISAVIRTSNADTVKQENLKKAIKEAYRRSWKRDKQPEAGWNFEVAIIDTDENNLKEFVAKMLNCHEKEVEITAYGANKYNVDLTSKAVEAFAKYPLHLSS